MAISTRIRPNPGDLEAFVAHSRKIKSLADFAKRREALRLEEARKPPPMMHTVLQGQRRGQSRLGKVPVTFWLEEPLALGPKMEAVRTKRPMQQILSDLVVHHLSKGR